MSQVSTSQTPGQPSGRAAGSAAFLLTLAVGYAVYAADRSVLSSVLSVMAKSLALTNGEIGLLGSAQYIGVLCVVFLAGHVSDRFGRRPVLMAGLAVFTVFTWLIGFSSSFAEAFVFRFVSGLGEGMFWPVAMATVASYFRGRKGFALGAFYVGFDAGNIAGLSIGGVAYSLTGDWRTAFFVAPTFGLAAMAGVVALRRMFSTPGVNQEFSVRMGRDALVLVRRRGVLLLMVFALLATWASVWQAVFLPYYFTKVSDFGVLSAALLSSVVPASGAVGKLVLGRASDSLPRNKMLASISAALLLSYALFFSTSDLLLDVIGAVCMGFFSSSIFPIMQALMADNCEGKVGTALGLTTTSQSVATVFSTIITASLFTLGVGRAVALDAMIPAALALPVALLLREPRPGPTRVTEA